MTRKSEQYKRETTSLLRFYQGRDSPVLKYISVTGRYVSELEKRGAPELLDELEYSATFRSVLNLVEETYRPDQFIGLRGQMRIFSSEFMEYILAVSRQLRRRLRWSELCDLAANYDLWRMSVKFREDSMDYATKNISLKTLWGIA